MTVARLVKFAIFGHAAASIASYELGLHKPRGFADKDTTAVQVRNKIKWTATSELISAGVIYLIKPEAALLLVAYTLPYYTYQLGRYHANVVEERAKAPPTLKR